MTRKIAAVQMDTFAALDVPLDGTLLLVKAALGRGYEVFIYQPENLRYESDGASGHVLARGCWVTGWDAGASVPTCGGVSDLGLADCRVVLMRQDPPYDMGYVTATSLLELLPPTVLLVNNPKAVRDAPEKIFITRFPDLMPPTLISDDGAAIEAFRKRHGALVLKPLYGFGAEGVQLLQPDDDRDVIAAYATTQGGAFVAQKFIPGISKGDKRLVLIEGEIAGAVNRLPQDERFLANIHSGGKPVATQVTEHEKAMVARFGATLRDRGILLAGVDVIDGLITEINVTCPSAIALVDNVDGLQGGQRIEEKFWDAVEARMPS